MNNHRNYAYGIIVKGKKRIGGTIHAENMEEAVREIAKRDNLTIRERHVQAITYIEWIFQGEKASIYVWAPPEYFL